MNKFPYIGELQQENFVALVYSENNFTVIDKRNGQTWREVGENQIENSNHLRNITTEYLANTYGKVESKEHAEFIVKLAEVNNIRVASEWIKDTLFCFTSDCEGKPFLSFYPERLAKSGNEKLITIPPPPKEKSMESQKEWPAAGDSALTSSKKKVSVLAVHGGEAWVKYDGTPIGTGYASVRSATLSNLPTPEEEFKIEMSRIFIKKLNELTGGPTSSRMLEAIACDTVEMLMKHCDIKKKPE